MLFYAGRNILISIQSAFYFGAIFGWKVAVLIAKRVGDAVFGQPVLGGLGCLHQASHGD